MSRCVFAQLCFLAGMALASGVQAQGEAQAQIDSERTKQWYQGSHAPEIQATQACGTTSKTASYPAAGRGFNDVASDPWPTETTTFAVTGWTGSCESGKRSGHGVISTRKDVSETGKGSRRTTKLVKAEGTYVLGLPQGLWCVLDYQALADGEKDEWDVSKEVGCHLVIGHVWNGISSETTSPYYRRLDDGRWQQMDSDNKPVLPEIYLPAGSVEAESARLIAEAQAGHTDTTFKPMDIQTNLLDGLVAGTHISEGTPLSIGSIKGKRVALVLSSNTLAELERFNRERQALLDASAAFTGEALLERNRFEAVTKQERLLQMMASALRRQAGEVTAVDDLGGLAAGNFDFAYVLDWHSLSHLDLLGKFKAFPEYEIDQAKGINHVAGQALGGFLISPGMKVVWRSSSSGEFDYKTGQCTETRHDHGCDAEYLKILADFYDSAWATSDRHTLY
ncbi:MAG: hypothetical protein NT117_01190 [Gammaproteobacteria bacterium]|nr:hypothetical protein [Gammaproteobacteria bacterium]